jgi:hypothetical protein
MLAQFRNPGSLRALSMLTTQTLASQVADLSGRALSFSGHRSSSLIAFRPAGLNNPAPRPSTAFVSLPRAVRISFKTCAYPVVARVPMSGAFQPVAHLPRLKSFVLCMLKIPLGKRSYLLSRSVFLILEVDRFIGIPVSYRAFPTEPNGQSPSLRSRSNGRRRQIRSFSRSSLPPLR